MKEVILRKWHRNLGIVLAVFLILQVGSATLISLGQLWSPHSHKTQARKTEHASNLSSPATENPHGDQQISLENHGETARPATARWSAVAAAIHHGGGLAGSIYRVLLSISALIQIVLGLWIYLKIRQRIKK